MRATTEVVQREGLRGLTFRAVSTRAGVANSLIVHHFGTRQKLLEETLTWTLSESIGLSQLPVFLHDPELYISSLFDLLTANMASVVFQYQMILESQRKSFIQEPVRLLYEQYIDELVGVFYRASEPHLVESTSARFIFATLDGLVLQYIAGVPREEIEKALLAFWQSIAAPLSADDETSVLMREYYPELLAEEE